jgi:hypothetical protein
MALPLVLRVTRSAKRVMNPYPASLAISRGWFAGAMITSVKVAPGGRKTGR